MRDSQHSLWYFALFLFEIHKLNYLFFAVFLNPLTQKILYVKKFKTHSKIRQRITYYEKSKADSSTQVILSSKYHSNSWWV